MSQKGKLTINGKDAYDTWGAFLGEGCVASLLTPAPAKALITNTSRLQHGKRVIRTDASGNSLRRTDSRDVTLTVCISAPSTQVLATRLESFLVELEKGEVILRTSYLPNAVYHLDYVSCTQFSQLRGLAKFAIKFNEPNPKNRT